MAHANVLLKSTDSWQEQKDSAEIKVGECMGQDKFDAILCVAGGWAGGNAASEGKNAILFLATLLNIFFYN